MPATPWVFAKVEAGMHEPITFLAVLVVTLLIITGVAGGTALWLRERRRERRRRDHFRAKRTSVRE
jgi:uncharacterized protein YneF (UPF0154 family)